MKSARLPLDALARPEDHEVFSRAFALGRLFQALDAGRKVVTVAVPPDLVYDADLVAMATGYIITATEDQPWRNRVVLQMEKT